MFGAWTAGWPSIRTDLGLSYVEIGVLLAVPALFANTVEPVLGVLGDAWHRVRLVRAAGVAFAVALVGIALSDAFLPLLLALMLFFPASGGFVGLSQATLMDVDPDGHELAMARWTLAGSVGVVAGPLLLGAVLGVGLGWRAAFVVTAVLSAALLAITWRGPNGGAGARDQITGDVATPTTGPPTIGAALVGGAREAVRMLRRGAVVRWLALLEFANLMLDVLHGFLALYLVDVVGLSGRDAALAIAAWTGIGMIGDALLIPLLRRFDGVRWLRLSALVVLFVYPAFLLVDGIVPKVALLTALGLLDSGWYAILQGRLYSAMPGRSATVLAVGNVAGMIGGLLPLALGVVAERYGLPAAMWLIAIAPVALLAGLPRRALTGR